MSAERNDWVSRLADEVIADAQERGVRVVCASGISPSGPIHLGNLREVMTPHLVADEVRRRGVEVEHLISWDDYDRFRKVPRGIDGVDESWDQYIGMPLTAVPPPPGSIHDSWGAHFRAQCEAGLAALGITYRSISQTEQYTSGAYVEQILDAMGRRKEIDDVLDRYRTLDRAAGVKPDTEGLSETDAEAAAAAAEGSGAASEDDGSSGAAYYPYKPYCTVCQTDLTQVTDYDDVTTELSYRCQCGHSETVQLREFHHGKLVWKVDWPMRWAYEQVTFEPSGVDHQSPGSSFAVGLDLAPLFGWQRPIGPMYAFVGIAGMSKMSSSRGGVPTPVDALKVMEPSLLRWLYARKKPNQSFDVSFGADLPRLHDEWDTLSRKVSAGAGQAAETAAQIRGSSTADGPLPTTAVPVSYRTLGSIVDITTGDDEQVLRIVRELGEDVDSTTPLQPRLDLVREWVATQMPAEERTVVRAEPNGVLLGDAPEHLQQAVRILLDGNQSPALPRIEDAWTLEGLTTQVYGVPKVQRGLDAHQIVKGDKELSAAQREFFALLYRLLVDADTGPRLPTLLLAIGPERVRALLGG